MADITDTLPDDIRALFMLANLRLRSVETSRRVVLYQGRFIAEAHDGLRTLSEWKRWLSQVMQS